MTAACDNDIILKSVCYGLAEQIVWRVSGVPQAIGVLGTAPYVLRGRLRKCRLRGDRIAAGARLDDFFARVALLEPTDQELSLAAELETLAQRIGVALDSGESQLCAIMVSRAIDVLVTGDKRAILALAGLLTIDERLTGMRNAVVCLEQAVLRALPSGAAAEICAAVCREPDVDKSLAICFSCASGGSVDHAREGLLSYVEALRAQASHVLSP